VAEIRVVNSTGGSTPFSSDRLAGFLVRLGQPPADALDIAATVEGELSRNRVDEIKTEALRRVAVDLATTGRTRLAVERALVDLVPLDPAPARSATSRWSTGSCSGSRARRIRRSVGSPRSR
jgi:hypothetical protein